jgi:hypothetical protein
MLVSPEQMRQGLSEYWDRRQAFRDWIKSHMQEGLHFGYPPGCKPGNADPKQWQAKPSLYKAGADFICDLLGLQPMFEADLDGWKQLGEPKGTFVSSCKLISRATGEVIGHGRGAFKIGTKGMQENASLKMSQKAAKVDAVLNAYGLSDLFTQDVEDMGPEQHENPAADASKPKQTPRAQRVTKEELGELHVAWTEVAYDPKDSEEFFKLIYETTMREFNPRKPGEWTRDDFTKVAEAIRLKRDGEAPPQ